MNENVKKLLELIEENPDLPVVCLTGYDVVGDGWGRWISEIGACYVGEYVLYNDQYYNSREAFMEDYYNSNSDILDERFGYFVMFDDEHYTEEQRQQNHKALEEINKYLEEVSDAAFIRAILVNIDSPVDVPEFDREEK